ncbi:MAG: hypothetical protein IMX00_00790 [Limnochordales bacterium]|nr:hypothetical protein [Limnochordales bacterium]
MAEEKRMVIEWGYYDKSPLPFEDKDEPCVLASVYHTGDSQERIVCLNVRLPGVAREPCEALWGHPVVIDLDIDLSDLDEI